MHKLLCIILTMTIAIKCENNKNKFTSNIATQNKEKAINEEKNRAYLWNCIYQKDIESFKNNLPPKVDNKYIPIILDTVCNSLPEFTQLLLERGSFTIRPDLKYHMFNVAIQHHNIYLIKFLLNNQSDNLQFSDKHRFIEENKMSKMEENFLFTAIKHNNIEACSLLLQSKACPNTLYQDQSALHYALYEKKNDIIELLLQHNANPNILTIKYHNESFKQYRHENNPKEEIGITALHIASNECCNPKIFDMLFHCGANPNKETFSDYAPIFYFIFKDCSTEIAIKILESFILAGANLNAKTKVITNDSEKLFTPYEFALYLDKPKIAQFLANSETVLKKEGYKKLGTSFFRGTMLREMGFTSSYIKKFKK